MAEKFLFVGDFCCRGRCALVAAKAQRAI